MNVPSPALLFLLMIISLNGFAAGPGDISVYGEIKSETGFRFPDGSIQTSAAGVPSLARKIIVAKSGGDFTSIQAAIDSITNASVGIEYLVWVGPGVYNEEVVLKEYVHLMGAGRTVTRIHQSPLLSGVVVQAAGNSSISSIGISCISGMAATCTGLNAEVSYDYPLIQDVMIEVYLSRASRFASVGTGIMMTGSDFLNQSELELRNVTVKVHGRNENTGIRMSLARLKISDSEIEALSEGTSESRAIEAISANLRARTSRFVSTGGVSCHGVSMTGASHGSFSHSIIESSSTVADSSCYGIRIADSSNLEFNHGSIVVEHARDQYGISGVLGSSRTIRVVHSKIRAETYTVANIHDYSVAEFVFTHFDGGNVLDGNNNTKCRFSTDGSLNFWSTGCP